MKLINYLSYAAIGLSLFTTVVFTYWRVYPYEPVTINSIKVLTPEVKAGGVMLYEIDRCRNTDKPVKVIRFLVDGIKISYPETVAVSTVGCGVNVFALEIPEYVGASEYTLELTYEFEMNPIRTVTINAETETFKVIK